MVKLQGNSFIVTGGASGLGLAVVRKIVAGGGTVTVFDLNAKNGAKVEAELSPNVLFAKVDVTNEKSVSDAIGKHVEKFGALRGVVNCAGVGLPSKVVSRSGKPCGMNKFEWVVKINLFGTFNVLRLCAAQMVKQDPAECGDRGIIINTASVAAYEGQIGQASYSASKAAVVGMTLPIARELARHGIRVNTIAPGLFDTPMMAGLPKKARESLGKQVPFPPRMGLPTEYASLAIQMIENQYFNGTTVRLDGAIRMAAM